MKDLLKDLNESQREALEEIKKPLLILAGAGSGKTKVITHKIAYLHKIGFCFPWEILAVTFTNKAANEMLSRSMNMIEKATGGYKIDRYQLWVGTFHSICARILRKDIDKIGFSNSFTIYDTEDTASLLKSIIKQYNFSDLPSKISSVYSMISELKNHLLSPDEVIENADDDGDYTYKRIGELYNLYQKQLKINNALDFDDLLLKTLELFKTTPEVITKYQNRFKYFLVDEFQDTNKPQYEIVKLLLRDKSSISVVGDDDQSIYSWRGADVRNILDFPKDFRDAVTVKLEQNYRSTNNILKVAHMVVKKNINRHSKKLWSNNEDGEKVNFACLKEDFEEAEYIAKKIKEISKKNNNSQSIAIFYRMNFQSRQIEEALLKNKIPYKIFGGIKFYERKEIKDLLSYFRLIVNEDDDISLERAINLPKRGIGKTTIEKIKNIANKNKLSMYKSIPISIDEGTITSSTASKVKKFYNLISELREFSKSMNISGLFKLVIDTLKFKEHIYAEEINPDDRWQNVEELLNSITHFEKDKENPLLENYLNEISLQTDLDNYEESDNFITLMTLHNSKGLEFDSVFVTGLSEGIFPHYRSQNSLSELEEERRLFYVGVTRGKKKVFLTTANNRQVYGYKRNYMVSSFISDINADLLELEYKDEFKYAEKEEKSYSSYTEKKSKLDEEVSKIITEDENKNYIQDIKMLKVGDRVNHNSFGLGTVDKIEDFANIESVLVKFDKYKDRKKLILKYANLELVE